MRFLETPIPGAWILDLERFEDERGSFARTFCAREFREHGLVEKFVQTNVSQNRRRGTVRGMHLQVAPHAEAKLVGCVAGGIFDVIVDVRPESPSYGAWFGALLDAADGRMMYVPEGCAHGFQALEDETVVHYQISAFYEPDAQRGFRYDDPAVGIDWPEDITTISERDRALPALREMMA